MLASPLKEAERMNEFNVVSEEFVPMARVKQILDKSKKEDIFEQKRAYEAVKVFAKLKPEEAETMFKELKALGIRKLADKYAVKIIDIMPKDNEELKTILASPKVTFKPDELFRIMEIVKKHAS